jgi:hypothetical protein
MATTSSMDLVALVREHLAEAHPDVLRSLLETFVEALVGAEVDAICGADYHQPRAHTSAQTAIAAVLRDTRLGTTRAQRSQSFVRGATSPTGSQSAVVALLVALTHQLLATCLRARGLDTTPREAGLGPWDHEAVEVPDLARWPTASMRR